MSCVFDIFFKTESTSDAAKDMNESLSVVPLNSKAKFGQLAHRMEQHIDADAERLERFRGLVNLAGHAVGVER